MPNRAAGNGRLDAVVLDADERQSLVSVRSLGRAGLRVGAFDAARMAPAVCSRWCAVSGRLPGYEDRRSYLDAVLDVLAEHRPRALLLARDATMDAISPGRADVERLAPLALAPGPAVELAVSKERTIALAERLGVAVPLSVPVRTPDEAPEAARRTGFPAVVKPVSSWVRSPAGARRLACAIATDDEEARRAVEEAMRAGGRVVVQQWVSGSREAVSLFCADGRIRARFAQVARRMLPPVGGSSIVRESIRLPPDLTDAAEALVRGAGLEGYSEVEFRRGEDGAAFLMEINPRLSASVEVAVRSGVDFPAFLYAWAAGSRLPPEPSYRVGVRMRWLGGDIRWMGETIRQRGRPDVPPPGRAVSAFARDFVVPHAYDYLMWNDLRPAVAATTKFVLAGPRRTYLSHRGKAAA